MLQRTVVSFIFLLSLCASAWAQSAPKISLQQQWSLDGFAMPESVLADPHSDWLYVSNVNGKEVGFLSRVSKAGKMDRLHWVDGIDSPTGMALYDGRLYVVNTHEIVVVDPQKAAIVQRISSDGKMLNDIAVTEDGTFYVGDLVSSGIYHFKAGEKRATLWLHSDLFTTPNGMLIDNGQLIVGTRLSQTLTPDEYGSLYRINLSDKTVSPIPGAQKLGSLDGLQAWKGGWLTTASLQGKTWLVTPQQVLPVEQPMAGNITDAALEKGMLYAPYMYKNTLVCCRLAGPTEQ